MAISRLYTFVDGIVPTAAQINGEFNNIINNALSLISPLTGALSMGGNSLTFDAAGVSNITSPATTGFTITPGAKSGTPGSTGMVANIAASTCTDSNTAGSGTAALWSGISIQQPTLKATNTSVVTTDAATLYIANAPLAGTNETITNAWSILVPSGNVKLAGTSNNLGTVTSGTWLGTTNIIGVAHNVGLVVTVASNALTIALKGANGSDPSATNPVEITLRNDTLATGTPVTRTVTSALSATVPSTATLGTTNGVTYRIYVGYQFDGQDGLVVFNTQGTNQLYPLPNEGQVYAPTILNTSSNSAGVLYAGTSPSGLSKAVKWLGYIEISEATAGTWATAPTTVTLITPLTPKSGSVIQEKTGTSASSASSSSNVLVDSGLSVAITPTNVCNFVAVEWHDFGGKDTANTTLNASLLRGSTSLVALTGLCNTSSTATLYGAGISVYILDNPATTSSTTYKTQLASSGNTATTYLLSANNRASITVREIFV